MINAVGEGERDIRSLELIGVLHRCAEETRRYLQRLPAVFHHCYELFRRALQERDGRAWEFILAQYQRLMLSWALRHPSFTATGEDAEYFTNGACARFWETITPDRFERFPDVRSLLRYLQLCLHSAITDHVRRQKEATLELDDDLLPPHTATPDTALDSAQRAALWEAVTARLQNDRERAVVRGLFVEGLKPRELQEMQPDRFHSSEEIYTIRETILARLSRDQRVRSFWEEGV